MTKIMFSEITALSNKWGYCTANNRYFADLYAVHNSTVSRWLAQLKEFEYVTIEVDSEKGNERKIYPSDQNVNRGIDEKVKTYEQKSQDPYTQKGQEGIDEKVKNNSTSINTTRTNNKSNKEAAKAAPPKNSNLKNEIEKEKPAPLPFQMWGVWAVRHEQLHGETPTQDPKFFNHLKQLVVKFSTRIEAQGGDITDENICNNFGMFLDMLIEKGDQWYRTNFTPDIFNSKFLNIIQLLKQQHNEARARTDKYADVIASFGN